MTATKTFQQRAENSCAPLRTPACGLPRAKGWRIKRRKEKKNQNGEREREGGGKGGREGERKRYGERKMERGRRRVLFRIPMATKQVRSVAGTVNRQKIYWSSPRAYR